MQTQDPVMRFAAAAAHSAAAANFNIDSQQMTARHCVALHHPISMVRAAFLTSYQPDTMFDVAIQRCKPTVGSSLIALPLLPHLREGMAREQFQEQMSLADDEASMNNVDS